MDRSKETLISIRGLEVHFSLGKHRTVRAVDGVTFDIFRGETLGLVGESGCGKTTLGRTLVGLVKPTGGEVRCEASVRRQMVFQDPYGSLDPRMTVEEIISEGLRNPKESDRVREWVEVVGLDYAFCRRYPHELSGGQRQRVGIARALAGEAPFIVADEPIASLDVSIQAQILNLLMELKLSLGLTYLFISHDLRAVYHIADRIAVMYLGEIVEVGPACEVFDRPRMPYTKALVSALPVIDPEPGLHQISIVLEGDVASPISPPSGCRFRTRCPEVMPVCERIAPVLRQIGVDHYACCHAIEDAAF